MDYYTTDELKLEVKKKKVKIEEFIRKHSHKIVAGAGAVAGLYFGYKIGEWHRGKIACEEFVKDLPALMQKYGECGFRSVMAWAKDHTPEAKKIIDDYMMTHVDEDGFKDVSYYFWENDVIKNAIIDTNNFAKLNHLKVRI